MINKTILGIEHEGQKIIAEISSYYVVEEDASTKKIDVTERIEKIDAKNADTEEPITVTAEIKAKILEALVKIEKF